MKGVILGLLGSIFIVAYEKDIKELKNRIHRSIQYKVLTWEDYVLFSMILILIGMAYILVEFR